MPADLAAGLAPELAPQLDAFQTPMRVEAQPVTPEAAAAQKFADTQHVVGADTAIEAALLAAADARPVEEIENDLNSMLAANAAAELEAELAAHKAEARGRQARIETPWMTPVVEVPAPAPMPNSAPTVEVAAEASFFEQPSQQPVEEDELAPEPKRERKVWPFVVGGLAIIALALLIEGQRVGPVVVEPAPIAPVVVVAPEVVPEPVVVAPEPVIEEPAAAIDVSENLAEATTLYNAGQYKKAISVLEQVVTDDPKSVTAWNLMAMAKYDAVDSAGAKAAAEKVLELDPKNGRVQILLASLKSGNRSGDGA